VNSAASAMDYSLYIQIDAIILACMRLTHRERIELSAMQHKFRALDASQIVRQFTQGLADIEAGQVDGVYRALRGIERVKASFQEMYNCNHTVAMIAAKAFLEGELPNLEWEGIEFARAANKPGPDIYIVVPPVRIVGELKTTEPCAYTRLATARKFGSNQGKNIEKDLQRLAEPKYENFARYMFVTSQAAYDCLVRDYRTWFSSICFVLLSPAPNISRPLAGEA
jgi:hypothetical protein